MLCGKIPVMKKAVLIIEGKEGNGPLWGRCSVCQNVTFPASKEPKDRIWQEAKLRADFQLHHNQVHLRDEDFSQAAARIVREATKD
jgi:hypothetical protein